MITLYGIKNCDTVKKARKWLENNGIEYRFHDFREDGMDSVPLAKWLKESGWENVLNRRSTSWRALSDDQKAKMDNALALTLATESPTLIKRPVTESAGDTRFGFKEKEFSELLAKGKN